ncbi:T9SS type A sorting domain-containing protein [candidate division KSB1 bacterium]|nr:T9SS type A sorting domain-containing protein [candidate division KSB1 bacterium]
MPSEVTVIAADVTFEGTDSVHLYFLQDDGTLLRTADVQSPFSFHLADMKAVPDGCVLLGTAHYGGDAGTDIAIIKLDASGYQEWTTTFGGDGSESASELVIHSDGACTILGSIVPAGGSTQSPYLLRTGSVLTSVGKNRGLSPRFSLSPAFPNPFNPSTEIRFEVGRTEQVKLTVFDLLGREVAVLADETMSAGSYARTFDGHGLASGMYLYRLEAGEEVQTRKMVLLK